MIGAGAQITDAYIGPYTAIGDEVTIEHAELEHSIVMSGSRISQVDHRIEASLIGKDVTIGRGPALPRGVSLRGRRQRRRADFQSGG